MDTLCWTCSDISSNEGWHLLGWGWGLDSCRERFVPILMHCKPDKDGWKMAVLLSSELPGGVADVGEARCLRSFSVSNR
eukprot:2386285-Amphidinium_carterae.1